MLAYYNLSTFYHFAHAKHCLNNISSLDKTFKNNPINAVFMYDFFISGFFLGLRTALDTLAAQIHLIFTKKFPYKINLTNITKKAKKYKEQIINKAETSWYNEFSQYRNHLDHGFFLIRLVDSARLVDISKLYPKGKKNLDINMLLQIYKDQNIYGRTPNLSNYRTETAYEQYSNYFYEAIELCKEILKLLKENYNTSLKLHIQSEITRSQSPCECKEN